MYKLTVILASCMLAITCLVGCSTQESSTNSMTTDKITFKPIELTESTTVPQADESLKLITEMPVMTDQEADEISRLAPESLLKTLADLPLATNFTSTEINVWPQSPSFLQQLEAALASNGDVELIPTIMETLRLASKYADGLPLNLRLAPSQPIIGTATDGKIIRYPTEDETLIK